MKVLPMDNDKQLKIPEYFTSIKLSEDRILLKAPHTSFTLSIKNKDIKPFLEILKDGATIEELQSKLDLSKEKILSLINYLKQKKIVQEADDYASVKGYYQRYFSDKDVGDKLENSKILLLGKGPIGDRIKSGLRKVQVDLTNKPKNIQKDLDIDNYDLLILGDEAGDLELNHALNEACVKSKTPFLSIRLEDDSLKFGPYVHTPSTPCFNCFDERIESNIEEVRARREYREYKSNTGTTDYLPDYVFGIVESIAIDEILSILTGEKEPETKGSVIEFNLHPPLLDKHKVLRLPKCSVCSSPEDN